ncbi:MAG: pantetheine-phosphate adenylyltransferase [Clostridia bacterium]|nr:pantetheine-phosphate adenylyltransferase [Clostridia bacterium]
MKAMFPGSFNPPTNGHLDVIKAGARMFETLYVAVLSNPEKSYALPPEKRVRMLESCTAHIENVQVVQGSGLTAQLARKLGAQVLVRGIRDGADFEYEKKMADMNRALTGIETVFLPAKPHLTYVSSSVITDIAKHGGDISGFVPPEILQDILTAIKKEC